MALMDVMLFSSFINARSSGNEELSRFYADRFRAEAKTAFDAWMSTKPFENPNAPPHPFVRELYKPSLLTKSEQAEAESQSLWRQAGEAGNNVRNYVLITVLLACALFCGGTASKFEMPMIRRAVLALGLAAFVFALGRLLFLPTRL